MTGILPPELMTYIVEYCERPELDAFCKTNYAMYTLAAPKLYEHLILTFRDPDEDYKDYISPYSFEGRQRALRGDFDPEKNAANRQEAFNAHCFWAIVGSDRIDRSWVKMLTIRYVEVYDVRRVSPIGTTREFSWPESMFDGVGDDSDEDRETAAWALSGPLRGKDQELSSTDEGINQSILMMPTAFPELVFVELPLLMYEVNNSRGDDFKCHSPIHVWDSSWFEEGVESFPEDGVQLPANLVVLVLQSQGDDHTLIRHDTLAGDLGKEAEQKWVSEFGLRSRLAEIIVKTRSSSTPSIWVTKFGARFANSMEHQGHCLITDYAGPEKFDSNVELLPDDFYDEHNCADLEGVVAEFHREWDGKISRMLGRKD
ncbi:MAG: hypothetical protein M1812_006044 [Candelaria pacifica]|nr:MAG: hypothetical protein M1812_006044 [Candelaria pacifica]